MTLSSASERVIAVDVARRMLELVRAEALPYDGNNVELVQADVRLLPFRAGVADFILNLEVLEHLPGAVDDVRAAFEEFRRILGPVGALITEARLIRHGIWKKLRATTPSWKEVPEKVKVEYYQRKPLFVQYPYGDAEIERLLRLSGFNVTKKRYIRLLSAGLVERYPILAHIDRILEKVPIINRFSREAVWFARKVASSESPKAVVISD